jgi:RNA polymerase Rpb5, N-terminal domain
MLRDRGYLVPEDQLNLDFETFEAEYGQGDIVRDAMTIVCSKVNDPQDQVLPVHQLLPFHFVMASDSNETAFLSSTEQLMAALTT